MPRRKKESVDQLNLLQARVATAPTVPAIAKSVKDWRDAKYPGITNTSRILLNHWFNKEHRRLGYRFEYYYFQREAVETLIYLYEVAKARTHKSLIENYATDSNLRLLQF